ncbi:MAG: FtsX-like permease family protein [Anaerolineae bacterium]|nr:FtsX-like permease family protein [Anaerolineae bacterium]
MSPVDLIILVLSNLNRMRGRVVMTTMGVVIGTSAIVVLIALSTGLKQQTVDNFSSFGTLNQITVFSRSQFGGSSEEDAISLTPSVMEELDQIEGVVAVTPYEQFSGRTTLRLNRMQGFGSLYGIDPSVVSFMGFELAEGDALLSRNTVIVGASVGDGFSEVTTTTRSTGGGGDRGGPGGGRNGGMPPGGGGGMGGMLFGMGGGRPEEEETEEETTLDLFGRTLLLDMTRSDDGETDTRTVRLRVGGVLESTGGNEDYNIYMSMSDMESLMTWSNGKRPNWKADGYTQLLVIAEQDAQVTLEVTEEITNRGFNAMSTTSVVESLSSTFSLIQAVLGGIASIALLVAAIGIANTMVMAVLERTREIGLMKAIGARNRAILSVFISEATAIGLIGGITGVLIGAGVAQIVDLFAAGYLSSSGSEASSVVVIPLWLPVFAIGFSMFIGMAAGIYPAFRAVQLDPVNALKHE